LRVYCQDVFTTKVTKDTKGSDDQISELRAPFGFAQDMLRDLRGELNFLIARDYRGEQNRQNMARYPHLRFEEPTKHRI